MNQFKVELTFNPAQAEAFVHLMDATCMSLEEQMLILNTGLEKEVKGLAPDEKKIQNITNYLNGLVLQHALCASIQETLETKIKAENDKPQLILPNGSTL
jgi:hypothetical protein